MTTTAAAHIDFTTGEGLRSLLTRIHDAGRTAWRSDRDVPSLMDYTATKYAPLARKHGLDAWEGREPLEVDTSMCTIRRRCPS